jgi:TM2 domain-containing membrane protein YozV
VKPVCPYCTTEIEEADPNRTICPTCTAPHHGDCWEENGGCTVFGCASAPGEGPTVVIGPSDIADAITPPPPPPPPRNFGLPLSLGGYNVTPPYRPANVPVYAALPKNRVTFILLGIFLGIFGAHNFYAGYTGRAIAQLCITLCTLFMGAIISWIWAIVEVCTVDRDSRNIYMA